MTLYAYCNSSLLDHSLNVLEHFNKTFISKGDTRVICKKITLHHVVYTGSRDIKEDELVDTCISLTRMGVALHDIGKGMIVYQNPSMYKIVDGKCKASYLFHEVFSSVIVYRLIKRYLTKYVIVRQLLIIPVAIALYHHYTMERLNLSNIKDYISKKFNGEIRVHPELEEILLELSSKVLKGIGIELNNDIIRRRGILNPIKASDVQAVFRYVGEFYSKYKHMLLLVMGLVGQASIIDYIVASTERGGKSKYLENLCREAEWLCKGLVF